MKLSAIIRASLVGLSLLGAPLAQTAVAAESAASAATAAVQQPVNINKADAVTLAESLRGIGLKKAEAIVAYREANGPFRSVDELVNVKGIGERTLEQLRPMISL